MSALQRRNRKCNGLEDRKTECLLSFGAVSQHRAWLVVGMGQSVFP